MSTPSKAHPYEGTAAGGGDAKSTPADLSEPVAVSAGSSGQELGTANDPSVAGSERDPPPCPTRCIEADAVIVNGKRSSLAGGANCAWPIAPSSRIPSKPPSSSSKATSTHGFHAMLVYGMPPGAEGTHARRRCAFEGGRTGPAATRCGPFSPRTWGIVTPFCAGAIQVRERSGSATRRPRLTCSRRS